MKKIGTEKMLTASASRFARLLFISLAFSALCPLSFTLPLAAEVPFKFNYQGNLRQSGFLVSGSRDMVFSIYDTPVAGVLLSSQAFSNVSISTGVFRVTLEPTLSSAAWQSGSLWLELEVDGNTMSPREEITSSFYAINTALHSGKKYTTSDSAPLSPNAGDLWMNPALSTLYFWNGASWTSAAGSGANHAVTHGEGGIDAIVNLGTHTITGAAGYSGDMVILSTGGVTVIRMTGAGDIYANKYYGDGSGLTGVATSGADNLGNHIATTTLTMANNPIINVSSMAINGQGVTGPEARFAVTGSAVSGEYITVFKSGADTAAWLRNK